MPAGVSFQGVHSSPVAVRPLSTGNRLPLGIGLAVAACASVGLWMAAVAGIKALFF
jgi:hypothetical protein